MRPLQNGHNLVPQEKIDGGDQVITDATLYTNQNIKNYRIPDNAFSKTDQGGK
jgi:hypothetical protein